MPRFTRFIALLGFVVLLLPAVAAPPQITKVTPATLQTGATVTVTIEGTDLTPNPRVFLPVPIAAQTIKEAGAANKVVIEVKLAENVLPGVYQLRIGNDKGISNPAGVEVDTVPPQPFGPQVAKVPATLQGTLSGSATLSTTLTGTKGQRLVVEVEARRLGSAIDPVVKLYDPKRLLVTWAQGSNALGGDARLVHVLPADGAYTIELHDGQYKAGTPGRFRLKVGDYQFADLAFPLAGQRGAKATFQLIGTQEARVEADLTTAPGGSILRLPPVAGLPGLGPRILVSDLPEVLESEPPPGKLQEVALPAGISGRIRAAKEEDRYRLAVKPGMKLKLDVLAERAGSALDGVLVLRNEAGAQLMRADDQPGTLDPGLEYTVPEGVTALVAAVSDLHGRGGPNFVYRLAVTPADLPDFSLAIQEDRHQAPRNGAALIRVRATRANYNGPIQLKLTGLPEGFAVSGTEIPAGTNETLLSLTVKEGAKLEQGVLQIVGESADPAVRLQRVALLTETPLLRAIPWARGEVGLAATEPAPLGVAWDLPDAGLMIGGKAAAKVTVTRAEVKGAVRLSLVTSQTVPKAKDGKDDLNRALRLEAVPTLTADQTTMEVKLVVPGDLPPLPYDVALRADLLAPDGKGILMTAVTPARRLGAAK